MGVQVAAGLARGEFLVPTMDVKCYVPLSGQAAVVEDPRLTKPHKENLLKVWGLHSAKAFLEKFAHLTAEDRGLLKEAMERCTGAFWVDGSPRTTLK